MSEAATLAIETAPNWFDDLEPAIQWTLVWYERAASDATLAELFGDSARLGYRAAGFFLGERRPLGMEHYTDVLSEAFARATLQIDHMELFDALPKHVALTNIVLANAATERFNRRDHEMSLAGIMQAALFGINTGTALALAEDQLAE